METEHYVKSNTASVLAKCGRSWTFAYARDAWQHHEKDLELCGYLSLLVLPFVSLFEKLLVMCLAWLSNS
jgi:hypothetical protein